MEAYPGLITLGLTVFRMDECLATVHERVQSFPLILPMHYVVPSAQKVRLLSTRRRAFSGVAPHLWNSLLLEAHQAVSTKFPSTGEDGAISTSFYWGLVLMYIYLPAIVVSVLILFLLLFSFLNCILIVFNSVLTSRFCGSMPFLACKQLWGGNFVTKGRV